MISNIITLEIMIYCFFGLGLIGFLFAIVWYAGGVAYQMGIFVIDIYRRWAIACIEIEDQLSEWQRR